MTPRRATPTVDLSLPSLDALELLATGRTAEVCALDDRRILKVLRPGFPDRMAEAEAELARRVAAVYDATPRCEGVVAVEDRVAVIYERIDGPSMDAHVRSHPWQVVRLCRELGRLHARMHGSEGSGFRAQRTKLHEAIDDAREHLTAAQTASAHDRVDELRTAARLCHGDLHPGNVLLGRGLVVIDWENVNAGSPAADVARTLFLMRDASMAEDVRGPMAMATALIRRVAIASYLAGYRSVRALDLAEVGAWRLPILAARLAEGVEEDRPMLLRALGTMTG